MSTSLQFLDSAAVEASLQAAPPGGAPSMARLAYQRLGFGWKAGDAEFNDRASLNAYIDQQLDVEGIDDSACEDFIAAYDRTETNVRLADDSMGSTVVPPQDCSMAELMTWSRTLGGGAAPGLAARWLRTHTHARAVLSRRQLHEVLVDFWTNHLNTTIDDDHTKYWEDWHVIRRYALGNFRDLLAASAKSPTMLDYLSNAYSDGNNPNENYSREVLELHALGTTNRVPGDPRNGQPNYSEDDVRQLAFVLSGWTFSGAPNREFIFNEFRHNYSARTLQLASADPMYVPAGGVEQGELMLDRLVDDPRTAWFISFKLCKRFISDTPETFCPQVIQDGAAAFANSHGDIRSTMRAILTANRPGADFASSWGEKVKRPLEFYAGALRALGAGPASPPQLFKTHTDGDIANYLISLAQQLFSCPPPTGYPDVRQAWWNTNQVFVRWSMINKVIRLLFGELDQGNNTINPAANLALDTLLGVSAGVGPAAAAAVDVLIQKLLGRSMSPADRTRLVNYLSGSNAPTNITSTNNRVRQLIGVLMASPYFQWR